MLDLFRCLYVFTDCAIKTCMQKTETEMKTKIVLYAFIRVRHCLVNCFEPFGFRFDCSLSKYQSGRRNLF